MNSKTVAIVATAVAFILVLCVVVPVSEESEAADYNINDSQSLKDNISTITNAIASQSATSATYNIKITSDIELDSLNLDFSGNRTEAKKYTINLDIGTKEDPKTLTLAGTETGSGITIANNGLDSITINIRYGNIIDNRTPTTGPMSTITVQGPGDGTGTTNATLLNMSVSSTVPSTSESSCILSVSDGASVTLNSAVLKTNGNDGTVGVSMEPNNGSKTTTLKTYFDTLVESSAQGILTEVGKTSISMSGNTHIVSTGSNAIQQDGGKLTVSSANVVVEGADYAISKNAGDLAVSGGLIKGTIGAIENTGTNKISTTLSQSGGVFSSDISYACNITSEYSVVRVGDRFYGSYEGEEPVASIGDAKYSSISYVNAALHSSDADSFEVTLLSNTSSSTFTPLNDVTINLNGYNLALTRSDALVVDGFSVEITGTGTLSLSALSILGSDDPNAENYSTLKIGKNVTVKVTNAIIIGEADRPHGYGVVVDVNGKIDASTEQGSEPPQGITVNGTLKDTTGNTPVINVNGEILAVNNSYAIYAAGYATWNIYGKVSGGTGIEIRAGNVNVYDGSTITSTAEGFTEKKNPDGPTMIGAGIAVSQHTTNLPIALNIEGGDISGPYALYEKDLEDDTGTEDIGMEVTGGTFTGTTASVSSENVKDFLAGGTFLKQNGNETPVADTSLNESDLLAGDRTIDEDGGVTLANAVAKVGSVEYGTIADAIADADSKDIITLLKNTQESITIPANKDIVLYLGTYTLTNTDGQHTITVESGATLTVRGSGTVDNVSNGRAAVLNNGTFTLESGKLTRSVQTDSNSYYVLKNEGTANIKGGEIVADTGSSSLVCNGGTSAATMTVTGGTIEQRSTGIALKNDEFGTLKITGGTIVGAGQALQNWNDADITGGFLDGDVTTWNYLNNGSSTKSSTSIGGDARISGDVMSMKYVDNTDNYTLEGIEDPEVLITGGEIDGTISTGVADTIEGHAWKDLVGDEYDWVDVSGGKFSQEVDDRFLAPGFAPVKDEDGNYVVGSVTPEITLDTTIIIGFIGGTESYIDIAAECNVSGNVTWESTDASVVTVSDGRITFVGPGWAYVHAELTAESGKTDMATVEVAVTDVSDLEGLTFSAVTDDTLYRIMDDWYDAIESLEGWNNQLNFVDVESESDTFTIPYDVFEPLGWAVTSDNHDDYDFIAIHFPDAGGYEILDVTDTDEGLTVTTTSGYSPFLFLYRETTGDSSDDSELPPFIPFPPEQGGDPVEVYPSGDNGSSSDNGDGTLKVVAVAAAAVIAAILAIVLASTYRKD